MDQSFVRQWKESGMTEVARLKRGPLKRGKTRTHDVSLYRYQDFPIGVRCCALSRARVCDFSATKKVLRLRSYELRVGLLAMDATRHCLPDKCQKLPIHMVKKVGQLATSQLFVASIEVDAAQRGRRNVALTVPMSHPENLGTSWPPVKYYEAPISRQFLASPLKACPSPSAAHGFGRISTFHTCDDCHSFRISRSALLVNFRKGPMSHRLTAMLGRAGLFLEHQRGLERSRQELKRGCQFCLEKVEESIVLSPPQSPLSVPTRTFT